MKKPMLCLVALGAALAANAQAADGPASSEGSFKVGRTPIVLPVPREDMAEVGYDNREILEAFSPVGNRLIAGFVLESDFPKFENMNPKDTFMSYALVSVSRDIEYTDCGDSDFREIIEGFDAEYGKFSEDILREAEDEARKHMEMQDFDDAVSFGKIVQLGRLFSSENAYGIGIVMTISTGEQKHNLACCMTLIRVRQRVLFLYYYEEYKGRETIERIRTVSQAWAGAILKANG